MGTVRLRELFGANPTDVTAEHVDRLVADAVEENFDLDFKETLYGTSDADRRALAADVAAFANASGGVVLLGIQEKDGRASASRPVSLTEVEERRMLQIVGALVFPKPSWTVRRVALAADPTRGYYLCIVERSRMAPHAVFVDGTSLRYPVRDQKNMRYLAEYEVAERYRHRFAHAEDAATRLKKVAEEGARGWKFPGLRLECALVPVQPGALVLSEKMLNEVKAELWEQRPARDYIFSKGIVVPSTGIRRIRLRDESSRREGAHAHLYYSELHTDGAGYAGVRVVPREPEPSPLAPPNSDPPSPYIFRELFVQVLGQFLNLLVDHATRRAGCAGDAYLLAQLARHGGLPSNLVLQPHSEFPLPEEGRERSGDPATEMTMNLDAIIADPRERLLVLRALMTDLYQAFGYPEVELIDHEGRLSTKAWQPRTDLGHIAELIGIPTTQANSVIA
ncbi:MAG: putative DNA binding domain-containing protein [Deltaproteobacteria bacterium]|nr:putative DNA binding domain-containing protein [Deltaproteobacteria bacterium]